MSYQQAIVVLLSEVLAETGVDPTVLGDLAALVEVPKDRAMGDFAFPCFRLAKAMRKAPPVIAAELMVALEPKIAAHAELALVIAAGPYLNFKVNKGSMAASLLPAILDGSFLANRAPVGEKVMIEYSQPNTHKAFHVGHTRNVALGDALVRIYEFCGHEVVASNYIGDEGAHIAKCLWYLRHHYQGHIPNENRGEFLGELYTRATMMLDFTSLTQVPMPLVETAKVSAVEALTEPDAPAKQRRVRLTLCHGAAEVLCGGTGYAAGDIVAYARPGARVNGRRIGTVEKFGVTSVGMILSEKEMDLSEDKEQIYRFPAETALGLQVAEYFRIADALPAEVSVLDTMRERSEGVAQCLHLLEAKDPEIVALWQETRQWSMDEFHKIYAWLGARFDHYFFESEVGDRGKQICLGFFERGLLVKSEGAIGMDLADVGLPFLLLIKSDGSGLYATKDIALAQDKFEKWGIDRSIYVVDVSQSLHFQQVFRTLEKMGYDRARNCYHLAYGMVKLPSGKMSSREGNIILLSELRDQLDARIKVNYLEAYRGDWSDVEIDAASRAISVATIRYGMTNQDNAKDLIFDMDEWTARTGNTGPYLMYAYARTRNILRKAGAIDLTQADWAALVHEFEGGLLNQMQEFPEVVLRARDEYRPQLICIYLYQLAKDFSRFYDNCPVLEADSEGLRIARLALVDAAGQVLRKGLSLLGIEALDRM